MNQRNLSNLVQLTQQNKKLLIEKKDDKWSTRYYSVVARVQEFITCEHCNIKGSAETSDVSIALDKLGKKKGIDIRIEWVIRKWKCSHCHQYTFALIQNRIEEGETFGPIIRDLVYEKQIYPEYDP